MAKAGAAEDNEKTESSIAKWRAGAADCTTSLILAMRIQHFCQNITTGMSEKHPFFSTN
jgi:hypothetical protein